MGQTRYFSFPRIIISPFAASITTNNCNTMDKLLLLTVCIHYSTEQAFALLNFNSASSRESINRPFHNQNRVESKRTSRLFDDDDQDDNAIEDFRFTLEEMYEHKIGTFNDDNRLSDTYNKHEDILRHILDRHNRLRLDNVVVVVNDVDDLALSEGYVCGDECNEEVCYACMMINKAMFIFIKIIFLILVFLLIFLCIYSNVKFQMILKYYLIHNL